MLELYHSLVSPCAQKVRLVLHEKGIEYESRLVNIVDKENLRPEYLALNPQGVVPTLVHDGVPVVESSHICEYLEAVYPGRPMLEGDIHERLRCRLWMKTADEKLHPSLGALAWVITLRRQFLERGEEVARETISRVPDPVRRSRQLRILSHGMDAHDVADAIAVYRQVLEKMEGALGESPWLSGARFGLADAAVAPYIQALHQYAIDDLFIATDGNIARWFSILVARPAYVEGIADYIPDARRELMAAHGQDCRKALSKLLAVAD